MKTILKFTLAFLILYACNNPIKNETKVVEEELPVEEVKKNLYVPTLTEPRNVTPSLNVINFKDIFGYWVGSFEPDDTGDRNYVQNWDLSNKITISIDSFAGDTIIGHSVVAGNRRPFKGVYELKNKMYSFNVKEPGDDKYDGAFSFKIAIGGGILEGNWKAYKKIETPKRKFALKKRLFEFNPSVKLEDSYLDWEKVKYDKYIEEGEKYIDESYLSTTSKVYKYNPSVELLSKKQVENLTKADLFILRNSIYAKHGYSFKKRPLRVYFDRQSWYMPLFTDIKHLLTDTEKENIQLLLSYEEHAKEYYDVFGR